MKYVAIRFFLGESDEDVLGSFDTEIEAKKAIDRDWDKMKFSISVRNKVGYRIGFDMENHGTL